MGRRRGSAGENERGGGRRARRRARTSQRVTSTASVPTHAVAVPTFGKFFLPGPTDVHPEVLEAMIRPMVGHRSSAMEKLLQGVAPKLAAVCRTARPVFIGTTSATGFMEMAVRTGAQKALALPPGLALGVASERLVNRARTLEDRGAYFDVIGFLNATTKFQPTNTPAVSLLYALDVQLARIEREGGIDARWKRHDAMSRRVEEWAAEHGVSFLPRDGRHSWTVSCLRLPEGKHSKDVVGALKQQGWTIGAGYGALKDSTIRIGHMGDHTVAALDELLPLIARALE